MKRITLIAAIVVAALFGLALFNPWTHPALERAEPRLAVSGDGLSAYLAENRADTSFIYRVSQTGSVEFVYSEPAGEGDTRCAITDVAVVSQEVYFIRQSGYAADGAFRYWELVRLDTEVGRAQTIYARVTDAAPGDIRLSGEGQSLYITFCATDGLKAEVYEIDAGSEKPELSLLTAVSAPEGERILSAAYAGTRLYCALSNGQVVEFAHGASQYGLTLAGGLAQALTVSEGNVFFADGLNRTFYFSLEGTVFQLALPDWAASVTAGASAPGGGFTAVALTQEGGAALVRYDGSKFSEPLALHTPAPVNLRFSTPLLGTPFGWAVLAAALIVVLIAVCAVSRKYFARLISILACSAILLPLFTVGAVYLTIRDEMIARRGAESLYFAHERARLLADGALLDANADDEQTMAVLATQKTELFGNITVTGDLLSLRDGEASVAASYDWSEGTPYRQVYAAEVSAGVSRALSENVAVTVETFRGGQRMMVSIVPISPDKTPVAALVTFVSMADITSRLDNILSSLSVMGGAVSLGMFLLFALLAWLFTRPLRTLPRQMNEIAEGRLDFDKMRYAKSEIGEIQLAMQEMCISLSIKDHETRAMLSSYYRFVPHGIETLLDRACVMEIDCGDSAALNGNVGIVTVNNRDEMRSRLSDSQFMDFVNRSFNAVYSAASKCSALFLSGDFGLSGLRMLFPEHAGDGVTFGMDLMGAKGEGGADETAPDFLVLLHSAGFLYGVAGNDNEAFPFLSSSELDFLTVVSDRISKLGAGIVVTDQYLKQMQGSCSSRYIGFVGSPDGRYTFKLHEVLDVYPESGKQLRLQYDHKFQEAIRLFYKNDFYLARSIFSALFKTCPDDNVVKWYIFACERFFNSADLSGVTYSILGIDD